MLEYASWRGASSTATGQTEYYLQFADHYFRVIADMRAQKDEPQRPRRDNEREQSSPTTGYDDAEDAR